VYGTKIKQNFTETLPRDVIISLEARRKFSNEICIGKVNQSECDLHLSAHVKHSDASGSRSNLTEVKPVTDRRVTKVSMANESRTNVNPQRNGLLIQREYSKIN